MRTIVLKAIPIIASLMLLQVDAEESSSFTKNLPPSERAFINAINLPAEKFFSAYTSDNVGDRHYAEIYLLGVLEATENISWCSYQKFKTGTIDEVVFEGLKKISEGEKKQRAATVIVSILGRKFPCKGADK